MPFVYASSSRCSFSLTLTITASKDGGAFAAISPTVTERGSGYYYLDLSTSHTDTLGDLHLLVSGSGAVTQPVPVRVIAINKANASNAGLSQLSTLIARLTAARAGYLGNLNGHSAQTADHTANLSTLIDRLSAARAGYLDNLNGHTPQGADHTANLATLLTRLTATRAGYLDKLNVSGNVASAADVSAITQAQRVRVVTPSQLRRPDVGSTTYRIWIYVYDEQHQAEDLDFAPTVTAENNTGTDRSGNLSAVTKPSATTDQYYLDYTVADLHAIEGVVVKVTTNEGGNATEYAQAMLVVDTTAVDFTASERAKLDGIDARTTEARLAELDAANLPTDVAAFLAAVGALNDLGSADIQAACNAAALLAIYLDRLFATAYDASSPPGAADALLNELVEDDAGLASPPILLSRRHLAEAERWRRHARESIDHHWVAWHTGQPRRRGNCWSQPV